MLKLNYKNTRTTSLTSCVSIVGFEHSHKKRKIVWKQTKRYCFNYFNPNFLEPRPPNLHKNYKQTEASSFNTIF